MVPHGYGLNASVSVTQCAPKSAVSALVVSLRRAREAVEKAVRALEHRARAAKAVLRQQHCAQARLRRPAGMQALGPCAFGEILDDARRHTAGDAERIDELASVEFQGGADARRGSHGTQHRGRVEASLVHHLGRHQAEPAQRLDADRDP